MFKIFSEEKTDVMFPQISSALGDCCEGSVIFISESSPDKVREVLE